MDKSDVKMEDATKQPQDMKNGVLESQNDSGDAQCQGKDQESPHLGDLKTEVDGVQNAKSEADGVQNTKSDSEGPNNVKAEETKKAMDPNIFKIDDPISDVEDKSNTEIGSETQCKDGSDPKEETPVETLDEGGNPGEKAGEIQNAMENIDQDNNTKEKGPVSVELTDEAPHYDTRVIDQKNKVVQMDDDVCNSENEGTENESKQSNTVAPSATATDGDIEMVDVPETQREATEAEEDAAKGSVGKNVPSTAFDDEVNAKLATSTVTKHEVDGTSVSNDHDPTTPHVLVTCSKARIQSAETYRNVFNEVKMPGDEDGTPEEQAAFMRELESFYRERAMEFKAPRFYGQQLNCLKLWRSVIRLGGYDRVTGSKLWRHVGESFHPPKTCTTVSWTFRIFYEKALLEYERYKKESGELQLPLLVLDPSSVDNEGSSYQSSGSGRARRDSATRAMQGWHNRLFGNGEGGEQTMKDKNVNNLAKREKNLKSIGSLKQKRPYEMEHLVKAARIETSKQLVTSIIDVGPTADWVKITVRETKDSFEVYALVPGLLREEVRVQSDPAGRLVITGQPDQPDNPWGITAFKKVVSLPARIDPLQTSAIVSLHGRLFVRVPFEQSNI